jgi:hypothetical protein
MPKWFERWSDFYRHFNRAEQKLDNVLLYVDFLPGVKLPIILLKDGSLLILFALEGIDYEGLSVDEREQNSYSIRTALEQLPDEGNGFMFSNLLIRDTPNPIPLVESPEAPPLIRFVQGKKQTFWNDLIARSFSNRILCGLRYFPVKRREPGWSTLISEKRTNRFYIDQLYASAEALKQGFINLSSGFERFHFRQFSREESFAALYRLINFAEPAVYRPDTAVSQLRIERQIRSVNGRFGKVDQSVQSGKGFFTGKLPEMKPFKTAGKINESLFKRFGRGV